MTLNSMNPTERRAAAQSAMLTPAERRAALVALAERRSELLAELDMLAAIEEGHAEALGADHQDRGY